LAHFFKNLPEKDFKKVSSKKNVYTLILSAIFFKSKHIKKRICEGFHTFCPNFHRFCPDFHQIKTFGGALSPSGPPPPTPLIAILGRGTEKVENHWFRETFSRTSSKVQDYTRQKPPS